MPYTVISSWVLVIARAIDAYQMDSRALFREAGLDAAKLHEPGARFSYTGVVRLWELIERRTQDPGFGLTVAGFWHPTSLHALGYSWLASGTLKEAFTRFARYTQLINTAMTGAVQLQESDNRFSVTFDPAHVAPRPPQLAVDAGLATLVQMCRVSCGEEFSPASVSMSCGRTTAGERLSQYFQARIDYDQPYNALLFDQSTIEQPLPTANADLARANDGVVTDYLARLDRRDISMRCKAKLIEQLPSGGVNEDWVADELNVSRRSLQRKLSEQGTTFTRLLDETRRDLSEQYIANRALSVSEITFLLGFSEPSNFSRAFKRWHGRSPSEHRAQLFSS